ncbi:MAG TPA: hypothetical protein VKP11_10520, partial [Frankiaceae bacterium]|nr:hypothetical protein [Frankiaceae bacterium]
WEVVRAVRSAHTAEPELAEEDVLGVVSANTGVPPRLVRTAVRYRASYPDEVDAEIGAAEQAQEATERAWLRGRDLLAG